LTLQFKEKKEALEMKVKAAIADVKDYYRTEMARALDQSKIYAESDLQKFHLQEQKKALEKFKQLSSTGPSAVWASKENYLQEVGLG
jgi:hypothetical protein